MYSQKQQDEEKPDPLEVSVHNKPRDSTNFDANTKLVVCW